MTGHTKRWTAIHTWSSLACAVFLFVLCVTGLPLIFSDEIEQWLEGTEYAQLPADAPRADLDRLVQESVRRNPGMIPAVLLVDDDEPRVVVVLARSWEDLRVRPETNRFVEFDARTGQVRKESDPSGERPTTVMDVIEHIHVDLFLELPGQLFLGLMGLLFLTAVVSGVVLYGPFMKKLEFGTIRTDRGRRLKWLDVHNLLGIVTVAWALTVGATGFMNELSQPLFALWQRTDVQAMLSARRSAAPALASPGRASAQQVYDAAVRAVPDKQVLSMLFPGHPFGSPYHYFVWTKGVTPFTSRMFTPLLVDGGTGEPAALLDMPWYLRALELSRPLHFGDYGGLPLKVIWVLLDLVTIAVLGSGLYLWFARRGRLKESGQVTSAGPDAQPRRAP